MTRCSPMFSVSHLSTSFFFLQGSLYFKSNLFELKTYHEVVDEIYYKVTHLEPWEKGSRKTAGQTGMCGGVSYCCSRFLTVFILASVSWLVHHPPYLPSLPFPFLGTWSRKRWHCLIVLLHPLQAFHAEAHAKATEWPHQPSRFAVYQRTWIHVHPILSTASRYMGLVCGKLIIE